MDLEHYATQDAIPVSKEQETEAIACTGKRFGLINIFAAAFEVGFQNFM